MATTIQDLTIGGAIGATVVAVLKVIERIVRAARGGRRADDVTLRELLEQRFDGIEEHNAEVNRRLTHIEDEITQQREAYAALRGDLVGIDARTQVLWIRCLDCARGMQPVPLEPKRTS